MRLLVIVMAVILSGCADRVPLSEVVKIEPVDFWYGLWHGMILPFSWFYSLFDDKVAVYAIYNNGAWYDTGFVIGSGAFATASNRFW